MQHPKFPCPTVGQFLKENNISNVAILWGTFGHDNRCLIKLAEEGTIRKIRIHFSNEVCRRNARCRKSELLPNYSRTAYSRELARGLGKLKPALKRRSTAILGLISRLPDTRFTITTGLEDNYTDEAYKTLYHFLSKKFAGHKISRNPMRPGLYYGSIELHSKYPACEGRDCVYSNDGVFISDIDGRRHDSYMGAGDLRQAYLSARQSGSKVYVWWGKIQGLKPGKFIPPRQRSFRFSKADKRILKTIME